MSNVDLIAPPIGGRFTYSRHIEDALRSEIHELQRERQRCEQEAIALRRLLNAILAARGTGGVITIADEQWTGADLNAIIRTEYDARNGGRTSVWSEPTDSGDTDGHRLS